MRSACIVQPSKATTPETATMQVATAEAFKAAFPFVDAALAGKTARRDRFIAKMADYAARPSISKQALKEARQALSRLFEDACTDLKNELIDASRDVTLGADVRRLVDDVYFACMWEIHRVAANTKRAAMLPESLPVRAQALAFLADVAKGAELLEALAGNVKTMEARQAEARAAVAATMTPAEVLADVRAALAAQRDGLIETYSEHAAWLYGVFAKRHGAALKGISNTGAVLSWKAIRSCFTFNKTADCWDVNPEGMARWAAAQADAVLVKWEAKIGQKLGKGVEGVKVRDVNARTFTIEATRNGQSVLLVQQMILNSRDYTLFNQFPARLYLDGRAVSEAEYKAAN